MSATLPFWLSLAIKMAITASFVVAASFIAQRAGVLVGAMVATLPISAGPVYVFLALDYDAAFISQSAVASIVINGITAIFSLTYAVLAQRHGMLASLGGALLVWFGLGYLVSLHEWTVGSALALCALIYPPCLLLSYPYRHAPMPPSVRRWYDLPLRAGAVSALVALVVVFSPYLGAFGSGTFAVFPIALSSLIVILHPRVGARATAAVIANTISGLAGFAVALAVLHLTAVPLGVWVAFAITLAMSFGWNLTVWAARHRGIPL
jgi:hypothetical protein